MDHDNFPLTVDGDISICSVVAEFCHFGQQWRCGCVHPETWGKVLASLKIDKLGNVN